MKILKNLSIIVILPLLIAYHSVSFSNSALLASTAHGQNRWGVGGSILYLEAGDDSYYFRTFSSFNDSTHDFFTNYHNNPDYKLGFRLHIAYISGDSGFSSELSWLHYRQDTSQPYSFDGFEPPASDADTFTFYPAGLQSFTLTSTGLATFNSRSDFEDDTIDFNIGKSLYLGRLAVRFAFDIQYAYLKNIVTSKFIIGDEEEVVDTDGGASYDFTFRGIGPGLLVDLNYPARYGFSVSSRFHANLLAGVSKSNVITFLNQVADGVVTSESNPSFTDQKNLLVPSIGCDVKLNYMHQIGASRLNSFAFWVGYHFVKYINAFEAVQGEVGALESSFLLGHSFSLQGPFVGMQLAL